MRIKEIRTIFEVQEKARRPGNEFDIINQIYFCYFTSHWVITFKVGVIPSVFFEFCSYATDCSRKDNPTNTTTKSIVHPPCKLMVGYVPIYSMKKKNERKYFVMNYSQPKNYQYFLLHNNAVFIFLVGKQ